MKVGKEKSDFIYRFISWAVLSNTWSQSILSLAHSGRALEYQVTYVLGPTFIICFTWFSEISWFLTSFHAPIIASNNRKNGKYWFWREKTDNYSSSLQILKQIREMLWYSMHSNEIVVNLPRVAGNLAFSLSWGARKLNVNLGRQFLLEFYWKLWWEGVKWNSKWWRGDASDSTSNSTANRIQHCLISHIVLKVKTRNRSQETSWSSWAIKGDFWVETDLFPILVISRFIQGVYIYILFASNW